MFCHIFTDQFIINSNIPGEIYLNNRIVNYSFIESVDEILDSMINDYKYHKEKAISFERTFYKIDDKIFDRVVLEYCRLLGLDYTCYRLLLEQNILYTNAVVKPYEPQFKDPYKYTEEKHFSYVDYHFKYDPCMIPYEFWINMIYGKNKDEYASFIYLYKILDNKKFKDKKSEKDCYEILLNPYNNLLWDNEFDLLYYNKRLAKYLFDKKYVIINSLYTGD